MKRDNAGFFRGRVQTWFYATPENGVDFCSRRSRQRQMSSRDRDPTEKTQCLRHGAALTSEAALLERVVCVHDDDPSFDRSASFSEM